MDVSGGHQCASCGKANSPGAAYCLACGAPLAGPSPYAAPYAGQPAYQYYQQPQAYPYGQYQPPAPAYVAGSVLTCPRCGQLAKKGGYQAWQIIIAICFFPIGLLALLADKEPSMCPACGFTWQA